MIPELVRVPTIDVVPDRPATDRFYRLAPDTLCVIGRDTEDGEEHELWDERAFLPINEAQVLSFMAIGVQTPLLCRRGPTGRIEVVEGRRRTIESREANRRLIALGEAAISVMVRFGAARLSAELQSLLTVELNERRVEDPPSVKARKAVRLLNRGISVAAVARAFGVTPKAIDNWRAMANAPPDMQAAADLGMIPQSAIPELVRAPEPTKALEELILEEKPGRLRAAAIAKAQRSTVRNPQAPAATSGAKMPRGAVRMVLENGKLFEPEFVRGVKFAKGELSAKEVEKILKRISATEEP